MNRSVALIVLITGIVLLSAGLHSSHSAVSQLSQTFNGHPTHETSLLISVGIAAIAFSCWSLLKSNGRL